MSQNKTKIRFLSPGDMGVVRDAQAFNGQILDLGLDLGELPNMKGRFKAGDFFYTNVFQGPSSGGKKICLVSADSYDIGIATFAQGLLMQTDKPEGFEVLTSLDPDLEKHIDAIYNDFVNGKGGHLNISLRPKPSIEVGLTGEYEEAAKVEEMRLQRSINGLYETLVLDMRSNGREIQSALEVPENRWEP